LPALPFPPPAAAVIQQHARAENELIGALVKALGLAGVGDLAGVERQALLVAQAQVEVPHLEPYPYLAEQLRGLDNWCCAVRSCARQPASKCCSSPGKNDGGDRVTVSRFISK
jgi:hypothetical protein